MLVFCVGLLFWYRLHTRSTHPLPSLQRRVVFSDDLHLLSAMPRSFVTIDSDFQQICQS